MVAVVVIGLFFYFFAWEIVLGSFIFWLRLSFPILSSTFVLVPLLSYAFTLVTFLTFGFLLVSLLTSVFPLAPVLFSAIPLVTILPSAILLVTTIISPLSTILIFLGRPDTFNRLHSLTFVSAVSTFGDS